MKVDTFTESGGKVRPSFLDEVEHAAGVAAEIGVLDVVDAGRHFGEGILRALDGLPPGERRHADERPAARHHTASEWLATLDHDREALFERALRADPAARLEQSISHGFFGMLNWRETLLFIRIHDLDHAGQLEKIATALNTRP